MPAVKTKSGLMAKYGTKIATAVKSHASDPIEYGRTPLPPGIINGIAKLTECKFDIYKSGDNTGEYYFRAVGVIVSPDSVLFNGTEVPVKGQQTSIMEAVCDTKTRAGKVTTLAEHAASIMNEMKKLGAQFSEDAGGDELETMAAALKEAGPYFRFSTSVRKAQTPGDPDGVWENWHGTRGLEDYSPDQESGVIDHTQPSSNGKTSTATAETVDTGDMDALVAAAEEGDEEAKTKLTDLAIESGMTEEEISSADSWQDVADTIQTATEDTEGETEETEEAEEEPAAEAEWIPAKEEIYKYHPIDPKTKKPIKKGVEVEVTAVDKAKKTVNLLNVDNRKISYKAVAWDKLESAS